MAEETDSQAGTTVIIIISVILVLAAAYFWVRTVWEKLKLEVRFKGVDVGNLQAILAENFSGNMKMNLGLTVKNDNGFAIKFKNLRAFMYYENTLIAQTSEELAHKKFNVVANSDQIQELDAYGNMIHETTEVTDSVNAYLNKSTFNLVNNLQNKPQIQYKVKITIFWIPFSYSDYVTVNI